MTLTEAAFTLLGGDLKKERADFERVIPKAFHSQEFWTVWLGRAMLTLAKD